MALNLAHTPALPGGDLPLDRPLWLEMLREINARTSLALVSVLSVLLLSGCASTLYPIASGSHTNLPPRCKDKPRRVVVWGNNPAVVNAAIEWYQQSKCTLIERAQLQAILKEQHIRLTYTPDDDADLLRVGKLSGADEIVFTEATMQSAIASGAYANRYGGSSWSDTVYHMSVAIRVVKVETGEIYASGSARYGAAINNPEAGLRYLTRAALGRALCRIEEGFSWSDISGCTKGE